MRPAVVEDHDAIERLADARFRWMTERGYRAWKGGAAKVASNAGSAPMWCLVEGDRLRGISMALVDMLGSVWTEEEKRQSSVLMAGTLTDPACAGEHLGFRIAHWAVDYAAQLGVQWARRCAVEPRLVAYYQEQGFALVRTDTGRERPLFALQRAAEPLSGWGS